MVKEDWAGEVLEVDEATGSFLAKLVDIRNDKPDRQARFRLDQVPDGVRRGLDAGQQFRWRVLGADVDESRRDWTSSIVLTVRREITQGDLELARRRTQELLVLLDDADNHTAEG